MKAEVVATVSVFLTVGLLPHCLTVAIAEPWALRQVSKRQHGWTLDEKRQPGDFFNRAPDAFFLGRLQRHDKRQMVSVHAGLLQNGVNVDVMPGQYGAYLGQNSRMVLHDKPQIAGNGIAR